MQAMTEPTEQPEIKKPSILEVLKRPIYALGLLVVIWFVFGQVVPRFLFHAPPEPPAPPPRQELAALNERIDQLEAKLKTYEEIITALPKDMPPPPPPPSENLEWQAQIEAKIDALSKQQGNIDSERLAALEARISNQQSAFATIQMQADEKVMLITAFSQMKEAILRGDRFSAQFDGLGAVLRDRTDLKELLNQLAPYAPKGILTLAEAQKQFEALAPKALSPKKNNSLLGNVGSLITIRKVGDAKGNDDEAIIARAETKLSRGDANGALKEIATLSPPAAPVFSEWVNALQASLRAREILDALQLMLVQDKAPAKAE